LSAKCLPLDFMGLYVLCGLETDKRIRAKAKSYLSYDINKRKDYVKNLRLSGGGISMGNSLMLLIDELC
jgi:hypothetical protein